MDRNLDISLKDFLNEHFGGIKERLDVANGHLANHEARLIHVETVCPEHRATTAALQIEVKKVVATINKAEGALTVMKWLTGGSLIGMLILLYKVFSLAHAIAQVKP